MVKWDDTPRLKKPPMTWKLWKFGLWMFMKRLNYFSKSTNHWFFFEVNDDGDTDYMELLYNRILV